MADDRPKEAHQFSNAYEMFTLVLTVLSLVIMVLLLVPLPKATNQLLTVYDNVICLVFLFDFTLRIRRAPSAKRYFFHEGGWLDLLGSIPSLGAFKYAGLFRLARLSRLGRIIRLMRGQRGKEIIADVLAHRGQYAAFVTILSAFILLVITSILVLTFETRAGAGNIVTGGDALWWAMVTLTTVGYGDTFPVTAAGRITGVIVMLAGVGIIGSLASILASVLVAPAPEDDDDTTELSAEPTAASPPATAPELQVELRAIRAELEALRRSIEVPSVDP